MTNKEPKTWQEYCDNSNEREYLNVEVEVNQYDSDTDTCYSDSSTAYNTPVEKSALAFIKIHRLIDAGYGGNVTIEDFKKLDLFGEYIYHIYYSIIDNKFEIFAISTTMHSLIMFHTKEQAEEFLSHDSNIQLLKDYFMIND